MKTFRIHLVFEVQAETRWEAVEKIWNAIANGTFRRYFSHHFTEKDKPTGWMTIIKSQLFGN